MISVIPSRSISRATGDVSATVIGNAAPPRCLWFSATLAGPPDLLDDRREPIEETRREVEPDVRYANIATTEGTGQPRWERRGRARLIAAVLPRRPYLGGWRRRTAQLGRWRRIAEI